MVALRGATKNALRPGLAEPMCDEAVRQRGRIKMQFKFTQFARSRFSANAHRYRRPTAEIEP
jgi:hypothetical protein